MGKGANVEKNQFSGDGDSSDTDDDNYDDEEENVESGDIRNALFELAWAVLAIVPVYSCGIQTHNGTCSICNCLVKDVVDCSNKNLTYIPTDLNVTTRKLNLAFNYLQGIDDGSFEYLNELISLDLYDTALKSGRVSPNAFKGLTKLKFLNISHNDQFPLTNMSTNLSILFEHIPSLQVLRMYGTTGTYNIKHGYPDVQLSKLPSLRELWIDGLTNMTFGPAFRNMTSLKVLRLAGDYIEPSWRSKEFCMTDIVKGMFDNLVSITHLYIRKCDITHIDKTAFQNLEYLEYLDLSQNKKVGLDKMFDSLCSLPNTTTTLILDNVVSRSPRTCGFVIKDEMVRCLKDKSLRELQLNHNIIHTIEPNVFTSLPKTLQIVSASGNEFYLGLYIFNVFYLTNLTQLDISYQFFTDETSIWRDHKDNQEIEDAPRKKLYGSSSDSLVTIGSQGEQLDSHDEYKYNSEQREDNRISYGSIIHDFAQQHFRDITHRDHFQYKSNRTRKICPQFGKDSYIPPGTVLGNIPPNLIHLDLSHSKHNSPIFELFINDSNSLESINASNSLLYCWDGPVHGLNKLVTLDLSNNFCTNVSSRFFQKVSTLKRLNLSYNFLGSAIAKDLQGRILSNLTALETLDISFNLIATIPKLFLKSQKELIKLSAKANVLEEFDVDISHMTKLRKLDLKLNRISTLSETMCEDLEKISQLNSGNGTSRKALFVNLRYNSIDCSCNNIRFIKWLYKYFGSNSTLAVNVSRCIEYNENHQYTYFDSRHSLGQMVDKLESQCRSYTTLIIGLSITLAFIVNVILGIIVHRFRWKLRYWYYVVFDKRTTRRGDYELIDEPRYKYDVFVASADDQKEFAIDILRPAFKKQRLTAFIPVYHINFNENLINVIGKAINESKVILFVFSDDWSSDHCMNIAVRMWQEDIIERKKLSVIGINLNNIQGTDAEKVKDVYCKNFIDYPGGADEDEQEAFWTDCVQTIRAQIETQ